MDSWTTVGWLGVNRFRQENVTRYKQSEVFQIPALLKIWDHYLSRYVEIKVAGELNHEECVQKLYY